jgi:hypothetical protein
MRDVSVKTRLEVVTQGGHPVTPVVLTDAERQTLQQWVRQNNESLARRAMIILERAAGASSTDTATKLGISTETVRRWEKRFLDERLGGLFNESHPKQSPATSGTTGKTKRRLRSAFKKRVAELDLRDFFSLAIGAVGIVLTIIQFVRVPTFIEVVVAVAEILFLLAFALALPKNIKQLRARSSTSAALVIILCLVICVPILSVKAFPASLQSDTIVQVYSPFSYSGGSLLKPGLQAVTESGSCFGNSSEDPRSGAWRCIAGSDILDPCFSSAFNYNVVVCASSPWVHKVILLKLAQPLPVPFIPPSGSNESTAWAWAIIIESGDECTVATGATGDVAGDRLDYFCTQGAVIFSLDRQAGTAHVQEPGSSSIVTERVLVAWL